ncbi:MAG: flagellin [Sulfuricurvum sp.]|nr:flagellin [Sulfuricurvum sp.]
MGFRINTNIGAMTAHNYAGMNNKELDTSLTRLSSGLRITKAADDASGMVIADNLRAQAKGLGQAIMNANDGIGVAQTADGALDEYINIINTVRTKSIQSASDGQSGDSRLAIQRDITRLLQEADNIAKTTSFNGINLLDGGYVNKNFQIGAYANQTVNISIDSARTTTLGMFALTSGTVATSNLGIVAGGVLINGASIAPSVAGSVTDTINALAQDITSAVQKVEAINASTSSTGVTATGNTNLTGTSAAAGGALAAGSVFINGVDLGAVTFSTNDSTGTLAAAFNRITDQTGVTAKIVSGGKLELSSADGYNVTLSSNNLGTVALAAASQTALFGSATGLSSLNGGASAALAIVSRGQVTLESDNAIVIAGTAPAAIGFVAGTYSVANSISTADVTTYTAAQMTIKKADHALAQLDRTRADIGSVQNQLESTIRNISVTQINVSAAESQIRDVDFAAESANFSKRNILAQSGSYAMSQANTVQQNVLKLLQ